MITVNAMTDKQRMAIATHVASFSEDPDTQVGCVVIAADGAILSTGANRPARGVRVKQAPERLLRPAKYQWIEHAERDAIAAAARRGVALQGATMYLPWFPCAACANSIVNVGIDALVCYKPSADSAVTRSDDPWNFAIATAILSEGGVDVRYIDKEPSA